jgi:hypothetical protein
MGPCVPGPGSSEGPAQRRGPKKAFYPLGEALRIPHREQQAGFPVHDLLEDSAGRCGHDHAPRAQALCHHTPEGLGLRARVSHDIQSGEDRGDLALKWNDADVIGKAKLKNSPSQVAERPLASGGRVKPAADEIEASSVLA